MRDSSRKIFNLHIVLECADLRAFCRFAGQESKDNDAAAVQNSETFGKKEMAMAKKTRTAKEMKVQFCSCSHDDVDASISYTTTTSLGARQVAAPLIWRRRCSQSRR